MSIALYAYMTVKTSQLYKYLSALIFVFLPLFAFAQEDKSNGYTSFEVFQMMIDQSINLNAMEIPVSGSDGTTPVTFGAEKEGSSVKILRVMSPDKTILGQFLKADANRSFAVKFIVEFLAGKHRVSNVKNSAGESISLLPADPMLRNFDWKNCTTDSYDRAIDSFVNIFPTSPFSFIDMVTRQKFFRQAGFTPNKHKDKPAWDNYQGLKRYDSWEPLLGEPELYIEKGFREMNGGWEINFRPQRTYADFEKMQIWFRNILGSKEKMFEAPGHQRVVMPLVASPENMPQFMDRFREVSRMVEVYVLLRGLRGRTGLAGSLHNSIITDFELRQYSYSNTMRGPIRLEMNRFYPNSIGIEFRKGMKDEVVRRFVQAVFASRLASKDVEGLAPFSSYLLIAQNIHYADTQVKIAQRLNLPVETVKLVVNKFTSLSKSSGHRTVPAEYIMPLWPWENVPFLKGKAAELNRISRDFVIQIAEMENPTYEKLFDRIGSWVSASNLIKDVEKYLVPRQTIDSVTSPLEVKIKDGGFDVNKIDLGNEFTARMPLKLAAEYDKNGVWSSTIYDMTPESREAKIRSVAESIKENFTGSREGVTKMNSAAHGHSLALAFEFKDAFNRDWRVEWDGISRNYDTDGELVAGSARGGHIEIVSPKYNPTMTDIYGVYSAMEKEGVIPDYKMGGSHINIDFEPFENNPQVMARFLSLFHNHRGIIAFMFQHMNRLRSAEPVEISPQFDQSLRKFDGSSDALAKLLYEEKYFNQRQNRKTRYTQIDVSNFMGRVIPEKYIMPDFDVVKARFTGGQGWAQQFRVTKHKKLEMRLFDAAADPLEAALQIKVVRALLNKAINETEAIKGQAQEVDFEAYVKDPKLAFQALNALAAELNLNVADYMPYVRNKLLVNKEYMQSRFYESWTSVANRKYPKVKDWGKPVKSRSKENMFYSDMFKPITPSTAVPISCENLF